MRWTLQLLVVTSLWCLSLSHRRVYHFINDSKSWSDAQEFCSDHFTDMATVNNQTNVSCVCPEKTCTNAWVRLNYTQMSDAQWKWIDDGNVPKNLKWENVPETQTEGNCAYVKVENNGRRLLWYNRSCEEESRFFCQNSMGQFQAPSGLETWCEARRFCESQGKNLASGVNQSSQDFIDQIKVNGQNLEWWVGLFRAPSSVSVDRFCVSEQGCAKVDANNKWEEDNCTKEHPFICYDDHMVLVKKNKTWEEALVYCRSKYGELAMMTNKDQQKMVQAKADIADTDYVWVGLHFSSFFEEWMWVNGQWVTSDNSNWKKKNEPHDWNVSGAMKKNGQEMWFKMLAGKQYNFVCAIHC